MRDTYPLKLRSMVVTVNALILYKVCGRRKVDNCSLDKAKTRHQASLPCALEQDTLLVQPRKTRPGMTEKLLTGT